MTARKNISDVKQYIQAHGYTLLSGVYKNNRTKLDIQCSQEHIYQVTWLNFQQGRRCPYCAGQVITYQQVKAYISRQGYKLLSSTYKNARAKLDIKCDMGHYYRAPWYVFRQGSRCPFCARKKITYDEIKQFFKEEKYTLLSKVYRNNHTKLNIKCPEEHKFKMTWVNFQQGQRCPKCSYSQSKGEKEVVRVLTNLDLFFIRQHRLGSTKLKLDFYIPSLSFGIEYDGQHHFKPVRFGGMSQKKARKAFQRQKENDRRKDKICKNLGIKLVRIPYTETNSIETILSEDL